MRYSSDAVDRRRMDAERTADQRSPLRGLQEPRCSAAPANLAVAVGNLVDNAMVYSDPGRV